MPTVSIASITRRESSSRSVGEIRCGFIRRILPPRSVRRHQKNTSRLPSLNSAYGLVSRVTPVHTAMRNCTRDEGRPFEFGNQVLISSHRKLLWSKAMVVNVAEKSEQDFDRYD